MSEAVSDSGLSAEEVQGHGREERRDALLMMQMEGHHFAQSFGELGLHELHASIGALHTHTNKQTHNGIKRQYAISNKTWVFHFTSPERNFQSEVRSRKVVIVYRELSSVCVCAFTAG